MFSKSVSSGKMSERDTSVGPGLSNFLLGSCFQKDSSILGSSGMNEQALPAPLFLLSLHHQRSFPHCRTFSRVLYTGPSASGIPYLYQRVTI